MSGSEWTQTTIPGVAVAKTDQVDTESDRFQSPRKAIHAVLNEADFGSGPIDRFEVHFHANGECSYRWRRPRAEEWEIGLIPPA